MSAPLLLPRRTHVAKSKLRLVPHSLPPVQHEEPTDSDAHGDEDRDRMFGLVPVLAVPVMTMAVGLVLWARTWPPLLSKAVGLALMAAAVAGLIWRAHRWRP